MISIDLFKSDDYHLLKHHSFYRIRVIGTINDAECERYTISQARKWLRKEIVTITLHESMYGYFGNDFIEFKGKLEISLNRKLFKIRDQI